MEILLIELVLWGGFALLFWVLKDKLKQPDSDMDAHVVITNGGAGPGNAVHFDHADELTEPIGTYRDAPIYRRARIAGRNYEFFCVCPPDLRQILCSEQRYLDPGLIYQPS